MVDPKLLQLIERLLRKTRAGDVPWEATAQDGRFQVAFPDYSVVVFERGNDWVLSIYNDEGAQIESVSDSALYNEGQGNAAEQLVALYQAARRTAFNVGKALDDLLGNLG